MNEAGGCYKSEEKSVFNLLKRIRSHAGISADKALV